MTFTIDTTTIDFTRLDNIAQFTPGISVINPTTFELMQYVRGLAPINIGDRFSIMEDQGYIISPSPIGTHTCKQTIISDSYFWSTFVGLPNKPYYVASATDSATVWTINYVDPGVATPASNGDWVENATYVIGNTVNDVGFVWRALTNTPTFYPPHCDPINWELVTYTIASPTGIINDGDQFAVSDLYGNSSSYPIEITFSTLPLFGSMVNSYVINDGYGSASFIYYSGNWRLLTKAAPNYHDNITYSPLPTTPGYPTAIVTSVAGKIGNVSLSVTDITGASPSSSPSFTGIPITPTPTFPNNTTQIANTSFITTHFAPLVSPTLSGVPTAPTPTIGDNSSKIATTAFVQGAVPLRQSWTPALAFGGAHVGLSYAVQSGSYTVVGKRIICEFVIGIATVGTSSGTATIAGLPFISDSVFTGSVSLTYMTGMNALVSSVGGYVNTSSQLVSLVTYNSTGSVLLTNANFTSTSVLHGTVEYFIA